MSDAGRGTYFSLRINYRGDPALKNYKKGEYKSHLFYIKFENLIFYFARFGRKKTARIDRAIVDAQFVMEMRAGRASGRADVTDNLSAINLIADLSIYFRKMSVTRRQTVAVVDLDHVSVTALPAGFRNDAVCRSDDRIAALAVDVQTAVKLV